MAEPRWLMDIRCHDAESDLERRTWNLGWLRQAAHDRTQLVAEHAKALKRLADLTARYARVERLLRQFVNFDWYTGGTPTTSSPLSLLLDACLAALPHDEATSVVTAKAAEDFGKWHAEHGELPFGEAFATWALLEIDRLRAERKRQRRAKGKTIGKKR